MQTAKATALSPRRVDLARPPSLGATGVHALSVDPVAAALDVGASVFFLVMLLHLLASVAAGHRTADRGERLALAAAHLMAEQAAGDGADRGAGDLMLVLGGIGHAHVFAYLVPAAVLRLRGRDAAEHG